jgi:flagellar motor switch protein FliG
MNAIRSFNGVERAAVLMMLVGEEEAAAILQKLDPDEVRSLGKAMFNVADVSEAEVEIVLDDFVFKARERTGISFDPAPRIESMMNKALGPERASGVLARVMPASQAASIEWLDWFEPEEIAGMIESEHPQIAAVLLANLDPEIAAKVFEHLPEAAQPQILRRIAKLGPIPPEAIETLKTMLAKGVQVRVDASPAAASSSAARARRRRSCRAPARSPNSASCPSSPRSTAMSRGRSRKRCSSSTICSSSTTRTCRRSSATSTPTILVKSLKGVEEEVRKRFLGCMSSRAADGIRDEMEALGPMKMADVLEAQKGMIAIARGLVKDGTLQMPSKGGDDDYV